MNTNIIVKLQVEGIHKWPNAPDGVGFLRYDHRHVFYIICKKIVSHLDRDIEIIEFKREITNYLSRQYFNSRINCLFFGSKSCEMIAMELVANFDLSYCSVLEDNENGAEVTAPLSIEEISKYKTIPIETRLSEML